MKKKSNYDPRIHHRRSIRLRGYDYGQPGYYFITICCQDRACLFGEVVECKMILNQAGKIAQECWLAIPQHYPNTAVHEFIIMPNHVHGIIEIITKHVDPNKEKNEIKGINKDNHHGLDMDNHHGLDMDNHRGLDMDNHHGLDMDNHHGLDMENHHGLDMDNHHGLDMDNHHGLDMDNHHGLDMDNHHGLDMDNHHGLDMDNHHGLDMDNHHGLDMDNHHGLDMAGGNMVLGNAGGNDHSPCNPDHHPKQLVQLFGVLKLGSPNGCVKIPMYTMFGKGIIMMILFGIPKNIIVFQNTLLTILQNGGRKNGNKEKLSIKMYFRMIN